jgi:hypothetical protein
LNPARTPLTHFCFCSIQSFVKEQELRAQEDEQYGILPEQRRLQEDPFHDQIYGIDEVVSPEGSGPFLPFWQCTPALPVIPFLNFNFMENPAVVASFRKVLESGEAVVGVATNLQNGVEGDGGDGTIFDL